MQPEKETAMQKDQKPEIERVGAGGENGSGQSGTPLNKSHGVRDRELGKRERVGSGGRGRQRPVGYAPAHARLKFFA
jgi:hypothetical protein